jgi:hypothetical protein
VLPSTWTQFRAFQAKAIIFAEDRLAASEIDRAVVASARRILDYGPAVLAALQESGIESSDVPFVLETASEWGRRLLSETEVAVAMAELIERVDLTEGDLRVILKIPISRRFRALQTHFLPGRCRLF